MNQAKKLVVVDSLGNGPTTIETNSRYASLAFPVNNLDRWNQKISLVYGDIDKLMPVYHSKADQPNLLSEAKLNRAAVMVKNFISNI